MNCPDTQIHPAQIVDEKEDDVHPIHLRALGISNITEDKRQANVLLQLYYTYYT